MYTVTSDDAWRDLDEKGDFSSNMFLDLILHDNAARMRKNSVPDIFKQRFDKIRNFIPIRDLLIKSWVDKYIQNIPNHGKYVSEDNRFQAATLQTCGRHMITLTLFPEGAWVTLIGHDPLTSEMWFQGCCASDKEFLTLLTDFHLPPPEKWRKTQTLPS